MSMNFRINAAMIDYMIQITCNNLAFLVRANLACLSGVPRLVFCTQRSLVNFKAWSTIES